MHAAKVTQNRLATASRCTRERITSAPATIVPSTTRSAGDIGPHQNCSGSARLLPRIRKHSTRPRFDGLKTWRPRNRIRYFESIATVATAA